MKVSIHQIKVVHAGAAVKMLFDGRDPLTWCSGYELFDFLYRFFIKKGLGVSHDF